MEWDIKITVEGPARKSHKKAESIVEAMKKAFWNVIKEIECQDMSDNQNPQPHSLTLLKFRIKILHDFIYPGENNTLYKLVIESRVPFYLAKRLQARRSTGTGNLYLSQLRHPEFPCEYAKERKRGYWFLPFLKKRSEKAEEKSGKRKLDPFPGRRIKTWRKISDSGF